MFQILKKHIEDPGKYLFTGMFFLAFFLYFALFNSYTLSYQEQIQLFRFSQDYFTEFLNRPGGMLSYLNSFIVQFFISPLAASLIITFSGFLGYLLSASLLRLHNVKEKIWPFLIALIILSLHSDYTYSFVNTLGYVSALGFTAFYISFGNNKLRYIAGSILIIPLILFSGFFAVPALLLWILHETANTKARYRFYIPAGYLIVAFLIPYIIWHQIFDIPLLNSISSPLLLPGNSISLYSLVLLFAFLPVILLLSVAIPYYKKVSGRTKAGRYVIIALRTAAVLIFVILILKFSYSPKNELIFKMDNKVQHKEWDEVTGLASKFKEPDRMVAHFTNLALYNSGKLGDELFRYNPADQSFLWLSYPEVRYPYFFGSDIFYQLGYINKAYAWAYDGMIGTGASPRLVKQLSLISLINGNLTLAGKYLEMLDQSLFYRKWSAMYLNYLANPDLISKDQEIVSKRNLAIHADFNGDTSIPDSILVHLLQNHPDNKMAYEYFLSTLLLEKNISDFTWYVNDLNKYGYNAIPVHFEEALLINMYYTRKNVIPEGHSIRQSTSARFDKFMNLYSSRKADNKLNEEFGNTYWYYFYFLNKKAQVR